MSEMTLLTDNEEPESQPQRRRLQPYTRAELRHIPKRQPLVKGLIDQSAMSVVYGPANCGKTFFCLDLGLHLALGWEWRGKRLVQARVIYIAAEGGLGIGERLEAFEMHHSVSLDECPFYVLPVEINLGARDGDAADLIYEIQQAPNPGMPTLVVVDTLSRALGGENENAEGMINFVASCDKVRQSTAAHAMAVHHSGKNEERGGRGHSSLRAATDTEIKVEMSEVSKVAVATVTKQRDAIGGDKFAFSMTQVELCQDEDGDPVTSCVVTQEEKEGKAATKLSPKQRLAVSAFDDCIVDVGKPAPGTKQYPQCIVVSEDFWRQELLKKGIIDQGSANPRAAFFRLKTALAEKGVLREYDGLMWKAL